VPNRRRLGLANVVCVKVIACVGIKEGKKMGSWDWVSDLKVGQLTLRIGPARAEVPSNVQRASIPNKRDIYTLNGAQTKRPETKRP
jgi:hypothetical protein